jgi:glycosyltransferase involved in cell wall biosynthesis
MTIAFVQTNKAFLPAITGYSNFFSKYNIRCEVVTKDDLRLTHCQVEWFFMGLDLTKPREGICKIHEYISPSVPPMGRWKDFYKRIFNAQPDLRIFKNKAVKDRFNFKDHTPFCYQDIGIPEEWLNNDADPQKEFDFIYVGDLSARRRPEVLIDCFTRPPMQQYTLLLLGSQYEWLQEKYKDHPNVLFKGPVAKEQVKEHIQKAKFGINYIPDVAPFNELTSTKLLEYVACGLPVVTTDYAWIRQFQQQYGGNYFYLQPDFGNFTWEQVINFEYTPPDLTEWTWEKQIRKSGVLEFLQAKFPECNFK